MDRALEIYNAPIVLKPESIEEAETLEDFESLWMQSKELDQRNQWFKGDILERVVIKFGEQSIGEFAKAVREKPATLYDYRRVARAFPFDKRMLNLAWTHYLIASQADSWNKAEQKFETDTRFEWIEKAHDNHWPAKKLVIEMALQKAIDSNNLYSFYMERIIRFGDVINQWDIKPLDNNQKDMLVRTLNDVVSEFTSNLKNKKVEKT